jgi:hypothetical protein
MEIGRLHVLLVHFPIALGLSAALADVLWAATRKGILGLCGLYCLVLAAISAVPTAVTGWDLLEDYPFMAEYAPIGAVHRNLAIAATGALVLAAALRLLLRGRLQEAPSRNQSRLGDLTRCVAFGGLRMKGWWLAAYAALMALAVALIVAAGHYGGMLAFGKDYLSGWL